MPPRLRVTVGSGAVLVVLALFGIVAFASVSRLSQQQEAVVDTNSGIGSVQDLLVATYEAERAGADFVRSGSPPSKVAFDSARGRMEDALDDLRRRAEDRPRQRTVLDTLGQLIGARMSDLSEAMYLKQRQSQPQTTAIPVAHVDTMKEPRGGMLPLIQRMREEELVVLAERTRLMARKGRISRMIVLGGSIVAFLVAAVVLVPVRSENA